MLVIENLVKKYGTLTAVNELNLTIDSGDIMGFIGPNGAGKTTTIKMIATLLKPTSGTIKINGVDISSDPDIVRPLVGYMPDFFGMYDDVRVWEYLDFFAAAYKIPVNDRRKMIDDVLELTDLIVKRESFVSELSRGMQQRLCLSKTILHDPKLLLLDEPASGLDPRARIEIKELLKELQKMGKTILISSHILPELADFCNKVAVIEQGKLVASGGVQEIMERCRGGIVIKIRLLENALDAMKSLVDIPYIADARCDDDILSVTWNGEQNDICIILENLVKNGFKVLSFSEDDIDLEDVFMKVTRGAVS